MIVTVIISKLLTAELFHFHIFGLSWLQFFLVFNSFCCIFKAAVGRVSIKEAWLFLCRAETSCDRFKNIHSEQFDKTATEELQ